MLRKLLRALGLIRAEKKPVAVAPEPVKASQPPAAMEAQILALQAKYEKPHYPAKNKRRHHKQRLRA